MHRTTSPVRTRTRHRVLCSFHMLRLMIHTRPCRTMGLAGISIIPKRFDPTHQVRISARSNMPQPLGRSIRPVSVPQSNYISGRHSRRLGTVYLSRDRRRQLAQWAARDSLMCGSWRGAPCAPRPFLPDPVCTHAAASPARGHATRRGREACVSAVAHRARYGG
jgi:hypothetical protein